MVRLLSDVAKLILLAGILTSPGLGTVEFCQAQQRVCHEAKAKSCCCPLEEPREGGAPCCVSVHQDWMMPFKEGALKLSVPEFDRLRKDPLEWNTRSLVHREMRPVTVSPDPPPRRRATVLALIQVSLI